MQLKLLRSDLQLEEIARTLLTRASSCPLTATGSADMSEEKASRSTESWSSGEASSPRVATASVTLSPKTLRKEIHKATH